MRFRCNSKSRINTKMSLRNDILRSIGCIPSGVLMLVLTLALIGCNHQVIMKERFIPSHNIVKICSQNHCALQFVRLEEQHGHN